MPDKPVILTELFASVFGQRTGAAAGKLPPGFPGAPSAARKSKAAAAAGGAAAGGGGELSVPVGSLFKM